MSDAKSKSLEVQFGGSHYKDMAIEPVEYILKNEIGFAEGSAIKYLSRHKAKGGAGDLKKAIHSAAIALEYQYGVKSQLSFSDEAENESQRPKKIVLPTPTGLRCFDVPADGDVLQFAVGLMRQIAEDPSIALNRERINGDE